MLLFQVKLCAICHTAFSNKLSLMEHYSEAHRVNFVWRDLEFESKEKFLDWKKVTEDATNSRFITRNRGCSLYWNTTVYSCHRSGFSKVKSCDRIRRLKLKGSKKINGLCPAEIMLREKKGTSTCLVTFLETHVGHTLSTNDETPYLFPRKENRDVQKIQKPTPRRWFADTEEEDLYSSESSGSKNIDKTAISSNVTSDVRVNLAGCSDADAANIEMFVNRYSNSVLYYKKRGEPDDKFHFFKNGDFALIFMSSNQQLCFEKYGNRIVAMDGIRAESPYFYTLHTILVSNHDNEAIPIAFAFSNREDSELVNIFLRCVKEKTGAISPKIFVTDPRLNYYNAWKGNMDCPQYFVYCPWHVIRDWNRNLNSKVKLATKRNEIRRKLNSLKIELDETIFYKKLEELYDMNNEDTAGFLSYFLNEYVNSVNYWAYCHHNTAGIDTSMSLEGFYRTLKYMRTSSVRKSTSLFGSLTYVTDYMRKKLGDLSSKDFKSKITCKLKELRRSHDQFAKENCCDINIVMIEDGWLVKSFPLQNEEVHDYYLVRKYREVCPVENDTGCCNLVCDTCNACAHLYKCTCMQNTSKSSMCKHIHAAVFSFQAAYLQEECDLSLSISEPDINEDTIKKCPETSVTPDEDQKRKIELKEDVMKLVMNILNSVPSCSVNKLKRLRKVLKPFEAVTTNLGQPL